jgi:hypothetical protein
MYHLTLTREPRRLKLSNSAQVLQYGSGPSIDFLAKILGVDTQLFVINNFIFQLLNHDLIGPTEVHSVMSSIVPR